MENNLIQEDPWSTLRTYSKARIALGHVGGSLPLREILDFKLAHANAKDAINSVLDTEKLVTQLEAFEVPIFQVKSQIEHRNEYLKRPNLGRKLDLNSAEQLMGTNQQFDLVFVLADGLSAEAINSHSVEVLNQILPELTPKYSIAIVIASQARVALGDEIGSLLGAKFTAIFIGERAGLSSPKSMGIYTTYAPELGLTDERRNCISSIHKDGLTYVEAAEILKYLISESFRLKISGVELNPKLEAKLLIPIIALK